MALDSNIVGGSSTTNKANVTTNYELKTALSTVLGATGYAALAAQNGDGLYSAGYANEIFGSDNNRLSVGQDTPEFNCAFTQASQDTGLWKYAFTTQTAIQSGGFVVFNNGLSTLTTTGVYLQSWRTFRLIGNGGKRAVFVGAQSATIPANQILECGFFLGTISTAPADGAFFRLTSAGIIGVLSFNGTETTTTFSAAAAAAYLAANVNAEFEIVMYASAVEFFVDDHFLGEIVVPNGNPYPFLSGALPICIQQRNSGVVVGPSSFKLGHVYVEQIDVAQNTPYAHQMAAMGSEGSSGPAGQTMGSTALYGNSLAAGAGVALTNTTAAAGVGLGGQFSVQPTLAVPTDGILCSFQNPAGTTALEGRIFMCTGVKIQGVVTTAFTGGPVIYAYSLAYGHTALPLNTAEGTSYTTNPTTKAPRRVPLGIESYPVTSPVGQMSNQPAGVYMPFNSPIAVNPGEFIAVVAKNLGTVTSAGVITVLVAMDGYWV
jgi:hypothetical protein